MSSYTAIIHCEDVANRERELYRMCPEDCDGLSDCRELKHGKDKGCLKCAKEHEQLAEWLKELKTLRHTVSLLKFNIHALNELVKEINNETDN